MTVAYFSNHLLDCFEWTVLITRLVHCRLLSNVIFDLSGEYCLLCQLAFQRFAFLFQTSIISNAKDNYNLRALLTCTSHVLHHQSSRPVSLSIKYMNMFTVLLSQSVAFHYQLAPSSAISCT